jgi:ribonuclease J
LSTVTLTVHRATNQVGGNCIEVQAPCGERLVLDVGRPLDAPPSATGSLPSTLDLVAPADVLISHPHQDHWGLLDEVPGPWPVHCGSATEKLIRLTAGLTGKAVERVVAHWASDKPCHIGPFTVTPWLTDHSAFDAYMLLIEVAGKRILYAGDFRRHGRKARLVERLMISPPRGVDVLIMEGTNIGSAKPTISEDDLESDFVRLFRETPGRVFVSWSAQNIDRTVTLYRACLKAHRVLVVDLYTAEVLAVLADYAALPRPGRNYPSLKVVITSALARLYRMKGRADFVAQMAKYGLAARKLAEPPRLWVSMVRPSLIRDYQRSGVAPTADDAWSWSMWRGYLTGEGGQRVQAWLEAAGARTRHIHTSGHASVSDLRAFATAMDPAILVPIHGVAWDEDISGFPPIRRLADGETMVI